MSRVIGLALVVYALAGSTVAVEDASAATIRECGSAGSLYSGQVRLYNVTSRLMPCRTARRFARNFVFKSGPETDFTCSEDRYCRWRGWRCRNVAVPGEIDHRCTSRGRVVRWQAG